MLLNWILNPDLAINELIVDHRVPKVSLEDKMMDKLRIARNFVPYPNCETLYDGRTWSIENGIVFKICGNIIYCITNSLSFLILAITNPCWGWLRKVQRKMAKETTYTI